MEIRVSSSAPLDKKTPCLVLGIFEGKLKTPLLQNLDRQLKGALGHAHRDREFSGKSREKILFYPAALPAERILLIGLGKEKPSEIEPLRQGLGAAAGFLQERGITNFCIDLATLASRQRSLASLAQAASEAVAMATYRFTRYRTQSPDEPIAGPIKLALLVERKSQIKDALHGVAEAQSLCRGLFLARDLVNEPGNVKSPDYLARQAQALAEETGMQCTVLDKAALEQEGMGALLGVAQGSVREPRLIVLEYRGDNTPSRPIALIGKGVVFDAGGISLKPAEKMDEMKMDMAGGAAVLGTLLAAALLKLPVNLVGLVPAVENLPSGSAIRPGDILTSMSGKTIEVLNTDAEGRLILADVLTYAKRFDPRVVIDLATLTGACVIALGHHASAVLGNHEGLIRQLLKAGEESGERLWQLPLWEDYAAQLKSDVADLKNTGGRPAGTITAGVFLQKFAGDFTWAHLDIAGTAWEEKGRPCLPKGGTGVGVRLLIQYLRRPARQATAGGAALRPGARSKKSLI